MGGQTFGVAQNAGGLGAGHASLGAAHGGLVLHVVDQEEQLALGHTLTLVDTHPGDGARDHGPHSNIHLALDGGGILVVQAQVARGHRVGGNCCRILTLHVRRNGHINPRNNGAYRCCNK